MLAIRDVVAVSAAASPWERPPPSPEVAADVGPLAPAPCASVTQHRPCDWCEDEASCDLKTVWVQVRDAIADVMDGISLEDLVRQSASRGSRERYVI